MSIPLVEAEALSRRKADKVAQSQFWKEKPLAKATADLDHFAAKLLGKDILDIGCGYGAYVRDFTTRGLKYYGIDNSPEMIKAARADHPFPIARFVCMSMNNMLFPDESFDGIWSCCSITTTPKAVMRESIKRMRPVLKPGGVMMTVVPNYGYSHDGFIEDDSVPFWHNAYTPHEFRELFRHAGFQIDGFWEDHNHAAMSVLAKK